MVRDHNYPCFIQYTTPLFLHHVSSPYTLDAAVSPLSPVRTPASVWGLLGPAGPANRISLLMPVVEGMPSSAGSRRLNSSRDTMTDATLIGVNYRVARVARVARAKG